MMGDFLTWPSKNCSLAIGAALEVECPRCGSAVGAPCYAVKDDIEAAGIRTAPHVERGRAARWMKMAKPTEIH